MTELVQIINNQPKTTSPIIARVFEKRHGDIIRSVESLEIPTEFKERNFALSSYKSGKRTYPMYEITRDGFTLLAMGFTGKKAMQFKLAYIDAFNKMEKALMNTVPSDLDLVPVKPHTRRLPSVKKEIVLSDKEHKAIGGIVKKCVAVAVKETLGAFLSPQEPLIAELKPNEKLTKAEHKLAEAVVEFGFEKERIGKIKGMLEGAMNTKLVEIMKHVEPI